VAGHTTPCRMTGRDCVKSLRSSYTGLYPQRRGRGQTGDPFLATERVVHVGRSTCDKITSRGGQSTASAVL